MMVKRCSDIIYSEVQESSFTTLKRMKSVLIFLFRLLLSKRIEFRKIKPYDVTAQSSLHFRSLWTVNPQIFVEMILLTLSLLSHATKKLRKFDTMMINLKLKL